MKIWFTRPSTWDLIVRGVDRCELWLHKPFFDVSPRGKELDARFPNEPHGWRVVDPVYGDISGQVRMDVRSVLPEGRHADVVDALWDAVCRSVDGKGPDEGGLAPRRWLPQAEAGIDRDGEERVMSSFLFEYEAPPGLWFEVAFQNGFEHQTAAGRWAQKFFPLDDELGIETQAPDPVKNPVLLYQDSSIVLRDTTSAVPQN
jgi:hypothetical protein